jgi:hypothetical protein
MLCKSSPVRVSVAPELFSEQYVKTFLASIAGLSDAAL